MKFRFILFSIFILFCITDINAQNTFPSTGSAGIGTTTPDASSLLEIKSTSQGLLIPRMTAAQRNVIASPATGLMIFQTNNTPGFYYYNGNAWVAVSSKGPNKSLSNLTAPTAVNVNLSPQTDNSLNLGELFNSWKDLYMDGSVFLDGEKFLSATGNASTFLGGSAGNSNNGGYNVGIGNTALYAPSTAFANTAVGAYSMSNDSSGDYNTALGYQTLSSNTSGHDNTSTGALSLQANVSGTYNTANGYQALFMNTTGSENVAVGFGSLFNNLKGSNNTAAGTESLQRDTASDNTAFGYQSLFRNYGGNKNTAEGSMSMYNNNTGYFNIANGYQALYNNTSGSYNVATGSYALYNNSTSTNNVADGYNSLYQNTIGTGNTAEGYQSLYDNTNGNYNTALGFNAYPTAGTLTNYTGIGFNVGSASSASNMVEIGNPSVTVIRGQVNFSTYSDKRIKNKIQNNVPGLSFINLLKPVTYNLDIHKQNQILYAGKKVDGKSADVDFAGKYDLENKVMTGFLAQDVDDAAKSINYDFSGVVKPQNDNDLYSLRYSDFVVPLVKAVQELSKMNDAKDARIDTLEKQNADLQKQFADLRSLVLNIQQKQSECSLCNAETQRETFNSAVIVSDKALLEQNIPNPFGSTTNIKYTLPVKYSAAYIIVTDNSGKTLKKINISGNGKGSLNIDASALSGGCYSYSLLVDGKLINTKQMVLAK